MINIFRKFNIKKHWGCCACSLEEYNSKNCFCWFDKKIYKMIYGYLWLSDKKKAEIDNDTVGRYVVLPQYIDDSRYVEMVKELNSSEVTKYFNDAKDEEDAHYRYRCFIDWNGLEQSEWYKSYLIISELLVDWCKKNNIRYSNKKETPPKNYIYDGRDLSNVKWIVDCNLL